MSRRPAKAVSDDSVGSLQEQVRLLSLENENLRNIISDKGLDVVLQERTENDNQTVENKHISINGENLLAPTRLRQRSRSQQRSPNTPGTSRGCKGCSCKGNKVPANCCNKVCGCVKKNSKCTALCKCSNACQNMDADKENNEAENNVSQTQNNDVDDNVFADSKSPVTKIKNEVEDHSDSEVKNRVESRNDNDSQSESDCDDKTKILTVPNNEATAMYKKEKRLFSEDEEDSESMDQTESMPEPETSNKKKPGKQVAAASNAAEKRKNDEESNDDDLPSENDRSGEIDRKGKAQLQASASAPISITPSVPSIISTWKLEVAEDFNPMKPRRQLSRSPIQSRPDLSIRQRILDRSEILLPIPQQEKQEEAIPPPEELEQDVIDWNKHQSELLECKNCKRKFYPYRLKKHEAFCHNI